VVSRLALHVRLICTFTDPVRLPHRWRLPLALHVLSICTIHLRGSLLLALHVRSFCKFTISLLDSMDEEWLTRATRSFYKFTQDRLGLVLPALALHVRWICSFTRPGEWRAGLALHVLLICNFTPRLSDMRDSGTRATRLLDLQFHMEVDVLWFSSRYTLVRSDI
jgi:hypothetical protein